MFQPSVLAIDIGGTKLAAGVVDVTGRVLSSRRIVTPPGLGGEELFGTLEDVARDALGSGGTEIIGIGAGCGGPMQYPAGVVSPLNIVAWRGFPLRERLGAAFGRPCVVDNDAKALALGEQWRGAGRGCQNMLGMVVSTGVGGGIILDGRLLHGLAGNAGHIGHIVVWPDGPLCSCGALGCIEGVAAGSGLRRRLAAALAAGAQTSLTHSDTAIEIAAAARAGDSLARELFRTAGEGVGRGIASAAAVLALELVVIGGGIALHAWDLLGPPLEAEIERDARIEFTRNLRVVRAELGETAGILGAAVLAFEAQGILVREPLS